MISFLKHLKRLVRRLFLSHLGVEPGRMRVKQGPAFWNGRQLCFCKEKQLVRAVNQSSLYIQDLTVFFKPVHPSCHGHALLDGCFTLYKILQEHQLLKNKSVILFLVAGDTEQKTKSFQNILEIIKTIFHFKKVIVTNLKAATDEYSVYFENIIYNNWDDYGFFSAYRESFQYMYKLREYGLRENIIFKNESHSRNIVNDFVDFFCKGYAINPLDWPIKPNRMILTSRKNNRKILNLNELEAALKEEGYDIVTIDFASLSIKEQIIEVLQSEYFVGTYGSNLTNALFLQPSAKLVVLWPKHGKFFISRTWDIIYSAFLSKGNMTLIEYDKPDYDQRDEYTDTAPYPADWFIKEGNVLKLNPKITLTDIVKRPHPLLYHLMMVNVYIDPKDLIKVLQSEKWKNSSVRTEELLLS